MDIVIPYKKSSLNGLELRYTLRGVEQYVSERGNVFLVGDAPEIPLNVIYIPEGNNPERKWKQANIYSHLLKAAQDKRVSDDFLFMADDHFLLRNLVPNYNYRDSLESALHNFSHHQFYRTTLLNTFSKVGAAAFDYGHGPMVFNKELFIRTMRLVDWSKPYGYAIKTLYCHFNNKTGDRQRDLKIKARMDTQDILVLTKDMPWFSIDHRAVNVSLLSILNHLYPSKSNYEND